MPLEIQCLIKALQTKPRLADRKSYGTAFSLDAYKLAQ